MKKIVLLLSMMMASFAMFAQGGTSWEDAILFDWENGNAQAANTTVYYKVDLTNVADGDNLVLFINNETEGTATVTATPFFIFETRPGVFTRDDLAGAEETTKTIAARHHAAKEIPGALIQGLASKVLYMELTTNTQVTLAAQAVEPGEVDLNCVNAPEFNRAGTVHNARVKKWYKVDVADVVADQSKSLRVTVKNEGTATANVTAGLSFDCPSTGTTNRVLTIAAGDSRTWELKRSQINMVGVDEVYLLLDSDQKLLLSAETFTVPAGAEPTYDVVNAEPFVLEQPYPQAAGEEKWYQVNLKDLDVARHLPEITLNGGAKVAHIEAVLVYESGATGLTRSITLGANAVLVKEIQRNLIETAVAQSKSGFAFIRLTSDADFSFSARVKARTEGNDCEKAQDFAIGGTVNHIGKAEAAWYALDIADAKEKADKDIKVTIENRGSQAVTFLGEVALSCPYTSTQSATRTIAAGATMTKVISNSLYTNLKSDIVYIGITADKNLIISAEYVDATAAPEDEACKDAKPFNLAGEVIPAGSTWYSVYVADFVANGQVPELTVSNNSGVTATITAEVSLVCPATNLQSRTITLADGGRYVKTPALNLLEAISGDYVWVKVTTNTEITAQAEVKYEDAGSSCAKPIEFNWTVGHDQAANTELWYAVDITEAKNEGKALDVLVKNLESESAQVSVDVAFGCPVADITSYTVTIAGNASKQKVAPHSTISNLKTGVVYLLVSTTRNIHFGADTIADVAVADPACAEATPFNWETGIDQAAGEVKWYSITRAELEKEDFLPQVILTNKGAAQATVTAGFTFDCAAAPTTKTTKAAAGATLTKKIDKALLDNYDFTTLYIRVESNQDIHVGSEWVDAKQGETCFDAIDFDWTNGHLQGAGEEKWYKIDITALKDKANRLSCIVGIANQDGYAGATHAELYFPSADGCDKDLLAEYDYTLAANGRKSATISHATVANLKSDVIYLKLFTAQEDSVFASTKQEEEIFNDFCDKVQPFFFNTPIKQEGDAEGKWYALNVKEALILDEHKKGAELIITNGDAENTLVAEVAYECPSYTKLDDKTRKLAANAVETVKLERSLLENLTSEFIYIHVTATADFEFIVKLENDLGKECSKPIVFDWDNGNVNPAGANLWYRIELTEQVKAHPGQDIRLIVENLSNEDAKAVFTIKGDCGDPALRENVTKILAANGVEAQVVSALALESYPRVHVQLNTTQNVLLKADFVESVPVQEYDTIDIYDVCPGEIYEVTLAGESKELLIHESDKTTWEQTWSVSTSVGIDAVDSIVTYRFHPILAPQWIAIADWSEKEVKNSFDLVSGKAIDVTVATKVLLEAYAKAWEAGDAEHQATTARVDSIGWQVIDEYGVPQPLTNAPVDYTGDSVGLTYAIYGDACDLAEEYGAAGPADDILWVPTTVLRKEITAPVDTVCAGELDINGNPINANTTLLDTTYVDGVQVITTYTYLVFKPFTLPDVSANITLTRGLPIDVTNAETQVRLSLLEQRLKDGLVVNYEKIDWAGKEDVEGADWGELPAVLETTADKFMIRYTVTPEGCGQPQHIDMTLNVVDTPVVIPPVKPTINVTVEAEPQYVCPGVETVISTVEGDTTVNGAAVITIVRPTVEFADYYCDSTYIYRVFEKVAPSVRLSVLPTAKIGKVIDLTASTNDLLAQLDRISEKEAAIDGDITWTVTGNFNNNPIERGTQEITITYSFNTCAGEVTGTETINNIQPIDVVYTTKYEYVCVGEDTTPKEERDVTTYEDKDVVTTIIFIAKTSLVLPAIEELPTAVCGEVLNVAEAEAALRAQFALLDAATSETVAAEEAIKWLINGAESNAPLTVGEYKVAYKVVTTCGRELTSAPVTITIEAAEPERVDGVVLSKYGNRLLILDVKTLEGTYGAITEEQVAWYRIASDGNDQQVATGFYYTAADGSPLVGNFYALIDLGNDNGCPVILIAFPESANEAPSVALAPNVVAPGEEMVISGLNADETYTITVYNLMGVMVERINVAGVTSYTMEAQGFAGYYMIDVQVADVKTASLKYIVK